MTVSISKPALSLRRELAKGAEAYSEQKFYFDGLVTNGTFDTDTTGWTATACSVSVVSGAMRITDADGSIGYVGYRPTLEIGNHSPLTPRALHDWRYDIKRRNVEWIGPTRNPNANLDRKLFVYVYRDHHPALCQLQKYCRWCW